MEPPAENVTPAEGPGSPPPAEGESIPLAPITTPSAAEDTGPLLARLRFLDGLLVLLAVLFAFVAACFRASNSDVYLHLAVGRLVADGQYTFGQDPFTFTTVGTWVNHAWAYCLGLYLAFRAGPADGSVLVVLKAVAVAASAWLMYLAARRPGDRGWIPAIAVMVGVLVMSPRLILSPFVGSILYLSAVMFLLARHEAGSRRVWLVPLVCLLWVNTDAWFFLGPAVVAMFVIGQAIQGEKGSVRELLPVLVGSVLACLVNPYHVWAFTALPPEMTRTAGALELGTDQLFRSWHLTVFDWRYYHPALGLSPAGLAYFPLVVLGLLSFALTFPRWHYWRVLLFLALLGLSLGNIRAIPFFAVVAAPIASLNFLDASERLLGPQAYLLQAWRSWAVAGRGLTVVVAVALSVVSVPGWLQSQPHLTRRFDLTVELDEGLRATARQIREWQSAGLIRPGERWFNLSPEVLAYFAWFCPQEKCFIDHRLGLYDLKTAEDFRAVRRSLQGEDEARLRAGEAPPPPAWRAVLRKHQLRWFVFHGFNLEYYTPTLLRLGSNPEEWVPCLIRGRTALFVWQDPEDVARPPEGRLAADFDRQAFGPEPERFKDDTEGPSPSIRTLSDHWFDDRATPWETWTAVQHSLRFAALSQPDGYYRYKNSALASAVLEWGTVGACATAGLPGNSLIGSVIGAGSLRHGAILNMRLFMGSLESGPAASPYLAIRAARQGLRYAPGDVRGWIALAEAYRQGQTEAQEQARAASLPHAEMIRRVQRAHALSEALRRSPPVEMRRLLHDQLIALYAPPGGDRGQRPNHFQDLFVKHQTDILRVMTELQIVPAGRLRELEKHVRKQETDLEARRRKYVQRAAGRPAVEKARLARESGLSQEAITLLLEANTKELMAPTQQGVTGFYYLIELLLRSGRLEEARSLMKPSDDPTKTINPLVLGVDPDLGLPAYDWFRVLIGAATGDYQTADEALRRIQTEVQATQRPALQLGETLLRASRNAAAPQLVVAHPILSWHLQRAEMLSSVAGTLQQAADLTTLRAWLALEEGRTADAATLATEALTLVRGISSQPLAELIVERTKMR